MMASEVQLDALPYVDQGYDEPGVREAVSETPSLSLQSSSVCVCAGDASGGGRDEALQTYQELPRVSATAKGHLRGFN